MHGLAGGARVKPHWLIDQITPSLCRTVIFSYLTPSITDSSCLAVVVAAAAASLSAVSQTPSLHLCRTSPSLPHAFPFSHSAADSLSPPCGPNGTNIFVSLTNREFSLISRVNRPFRSSPTICPRKCASSSPILIPLVGMCARTSSAVGKGGEFGLVIGGEVGLVPGGDLGPPAAGASGLPAREAVAEPEGVPLVFPLLGMPSLSLMRLCVPSDISPPEPARPSLSEPEPAPTARGRLAGTAADAVRGWGADEVGRLALGGEPGRDGGLRLGCEEAD